MPQSGFTPIITYNTATASAAPSAGNLTQGELAVNVTDKKLYTKNSGGSVVQVGSGPDATETLTNKTLTSPDINGGTIDGTALGSTTPAAGSFTTLSSVGAIASYTDANTLKLGFDGATGTLAATRTSGNYSSLEFRTSGADGNGLVRATIDSAGVLSLTKGQLNFPATQVPSADVNTLDDYEEGTWTPTQGGGLTVVGGFSSSGTYTKVGRFVTVIGQVNGATSITVNTSAIMCGGLPFSASGTGCGSITNGTLSQSGTVYTAGGNVWSSAISTATPGLYFTLTYFV